MFWPRPLGLVIFIASQRMCGCPGCCAQYRKEKQANITHAVGQAAITQYAGQKTRVHTPGQQNARLLVHAETLFWTLHWALQKPMRWVCLGTAGAYSTHLPLQTPNVRGRIC